jgi:hypothetical protein
MIGRQPIPDVRCQQKPLPTATLNEVPRHARRVLKAAEATPLRDSLRPGRESQFTSGRACNRGDGGGSKALTRQVLQSHKHLATRQRRPASGVPARRARAGARAAPSALSRAAGGPCAVGRDRCEHRGVVSPARPVPGAAAAAVASVDVQLGGAAGAPPGASAPGRAYDASPSSRSSAACTCASSPRVPGTARVATPEGVRALEGAALQVAKPLTAVETRSRACAGSCSR